MDDPLLVEVQSEDYWYEGYNMRTGARGIFPAYYAIEVTKDPESFKGTNAEMIINYSRTDRECVSRETEMPDRNSAQHCYMKPVSKASWC